MQPLAEKFALMLLTLSNRHDLLKHEGNFTKLADVFLLLQDKNSLDYTDYDHDDDHNLVFYNEQEGGVGVAGGDCIQCLSD